MPNLIKFFLSIIFIFELSLAKAQPTPEILDTLVYNNKKILLNSDRTWNYFDSQINPNHYSFDTCVFNCMDHKQIFAYLSEKDKSSFKDKIHQYDTLKASVIPIKGPIYGIFTKHHQGVDIGLKKGEKISAVFDGKVRYAAYHKNGYGKLVIIRHYNGLETWYAHLSVIRVVEGQDVVAGDIIGLGGSTGRSKAPHLHFEIRYHDIPMDPLRKINFNNDYIVPKRALYSNMQDSLMEAPDTTASDSLIQMPVYVKDTLKAEVKKEKTNKEKANLHIVKKGDTLNNISKRYGTTIDRICELNNLKKEAILSIGQKIKIPK